MASGAALVAGSTGFAAAKTGKAPVTRSEHDAVVQGYDNPQAVRGVLSDHEDMLETLAEEGLVETGRAVGLRLDLSGGVRDGSHEHVSSVRQTDGSVTPEIKITRKVDGEMLTIAVRPETGERWVLQGPPETNDPIVRDDLSTMACCSCCGTKSYCCRSCCVPCFCDPDCAEWCYECTCPDGCC